MKNAPPPAPKPPKISSSSGSQNQRTSKKKGPGGNPHGNAKNPPLQQLDLNLATEIRWQHRALHKNEDLSIVCDAKVLLCIIQERYGGNFYRVFELSRKRQLLQQQQKQKNAANTDADTITNTTTSVTDHLVDIRVATIAVRFARYIHRTRKRKWGRNKALNHSMDAKSLTVLSKMAAAFLYTIGLMLELEVDKTFQYWDRMNRLLSLFHDGSGNITVREVYDIYNRKHYTQNQQQHYPYKKQIGRYYREAVSQVFSVPNYNPSPPRAANHHASLDHKTLAPHVEKCVANALAQSSLSQQQQQQQQQQQTLAQVKSSQQCGQQQGPTTTTGLNTNTAILDNKVQQQQSETTTSSPTGNGKQKSFAQLVESMQKNITSTTDSCNATMGYNTSPSKQQTPCNSYTDTFGAGSLSTPQYQQQQQQQQHVDVSPSNVAHYLSPPSPPPTNNNQQQTTLTNNLSSSQVNTGRSGAEVVTSRQQVASALMELFTSTEKTELPLSPGGNYHQNLLTTTTRTSTAEKEVVASNSVAVVPDVKHPHAATTLLQDPIHSALTDTKQQTGQLEITMFGKTATNNEDCIAHEDSTACTPNFNQNDNQTVERIDTPSHTVSAAMMKQPQLQPQDQDQDQDQDQERPCTKFGSTTMPSSNKPINPEIRVDPPNTTVSTSTVNDSRKPPRKRRFHCNNNHNVTLNHNSPSSSSLIIGKEPSQQKHDVPIEESTEKASVFSPDISDASRCRKLQKTTNFSGTFRPAYEVATASAPTVIHTSEQLTSKSTDGMSTVETLSTLDVLDSSTVSEAKKTSLSCGTAEQTIQVLKPSVACATSPPLGVKPSNEANISTMLSLKQNESSSAVRSCEQLNSSSSNTNTGNSIVLSNETIPGDRNVIFKTILATCEVDRTVVTKDESKDVSQDTTVQTRDSSGVSSHDISQSISLGPGSSPTSPHTEPITVDQLGNMRPASDSRDETIQVCTPPHTEPITVDQLVNMRPVSDVQDEVIQTAPDKDAMDVESSVSLTKPDVVHCAKPLTTVTEELEGNTNQTTVVSASLSSCVAHSMDHTGIQKETGTVEVLLSTTDAIDNSPTDCNSRSRSKGREPGKDKSMMGSSIEPVSACTSVVEDVMSIKIANPSTDTIDRKDNIQVSSLQKTSLCVTKPTDVTLNSQHVKKDKPACDDKALATFEPSGDSEKDTENNFKKSTDMPRIELPWNKKDHIKVKPMIGWGICNDAGDNAKPWVDSRSCCLCGICGDDDAGLRPNMTKGVEADNFRDRGEIGNASEEEEQTQILTRAGRLLPLSNDLWVHAECAVWSSEVWEDINGGILHGVQKARSRGIKLKCSGCACQGATLGCHKANCGANYHFSCAKACGVLFTSQHKLYCPAHKGSAKDSTPFEFSEHMKTLRVAPTNNKDISDHVPETKACYRLGTLVVHSLGTIEQDCDGFHSKHYITPPGYTSTRIFWSYVKPKSRTLYVMKIGRSAKNTAVYSIVAADAPSSPFQGSSASKVSNQIMDRVHETNKQFFATRDDLFSVFPMERTKEDKKLGYCLNSAQFFGFGLDNIRKALEMSPGAVACAVPLTVKSKPYKFCFINPREEQVVDLQRKRAANLAEKALENASGCARTEGTSAVDKSSGSGRITRALVRKPKEGEGSKQNADDGNKDRNGGPSSSVTGESKRDFESNQAKYCEMKSVPLDHRLAAKRSHIHGWGLFAKVNLSKHSMIAEYMGETIRQCVADKREFAYEKSGIGSCYMFRLDMQHIVDATRIGCMARFMNHCCAANAYAKIISVYTEQGLTKKIVVFANQDISAGDEITYDYKFPVEDGSLRCTCGAPNCIGRMN